MSDTKPTPRVTRTPAWLILLLVAGVPTVVTIAGILIGAHVVEIIVFSMLCLFSLALVFFYSLG